MNPHIWLEEETVPYVRNALSQIVQSHKEVSVVPTPPPPAVVPSVPPVKPGSVSGVTIASNCFGDLIPIPQPEVTLSTVLSAEQVKEKAETVDILVPTPPPVPQREVMSSGISKVGSDASDRGQWWKSNFTRTASRKYCRVLWT